MATRLFIGGLNYRTTEAQLAAFIEEVAPVATKKNREGLDVTDHNGALVPAVNIILDRTFEPPRSKGFGFVDMVDDAGAQKVIAQLNEQELDGRSLRINEAQERQPRPSFGTPQAAEPSTYNQPSPEESPTEHETTLYTAEAADTEKS